MVATALGLFAFFLVCLIIGFAANGIADTFNVSDEIARAIVGVLVCAVGGIAFARQEDAMGRILIAAGVVIAFVVAVGVRGAYRTPAYDICDVVENWDQSGECD